MVNDVKNMTTDMENWDETVEEIERLLRKVSSIVFRRGREILSNFSITPPQFNALLVLIRADEKLTMGELCQHLYLASSTVTDLVDRLEASDLVRRVRDPNDRRAIRLEVQEKGEDIFKQVMAARRAYLSSVLEKEDPADRAQLRASLSDLFLLIEEEERIRD